MVQVRVHIGQFQQLFEIVKSGIAAATFQIAHEGRAIYRCKNLIVTADYHRPFRVARKLGELPRRRCAQAANPAGIGTDKITMRTARFDASITPDLQRDRIVTKGDANIFQHPVNLGFDPFKACKIQRIKMPKSPLDPGRFGRSHDIRSGPSCAANTSCHIIVSPARHLADTGTDTGDSCFFIRPCGVLRTT